MLASSVRVDEVASAIASFDHRFGEMEHVTWWLSQACRNELLSRQNTRLLEELVWLVKRWMGIQGVTHAVKGIAACALVSLPWTPESFAETRTYSASEEQFACDRVANLVETMMEFGAQRREYSLASKVLHWLTPWHIPVYDKYVRDMLLITGRDEDAYRQLVAWEFDAARRLTAEGVEWIGGMQPWSALRAIDKYLWWKGGGECGNAVVVTDPWKEVRHLGIGLPERLATTRPL